MTSSIQQPPRGVRLTLEEIADLFGVTKQAVANVESIALRKLAKNPSVRQAAVDLGIPLPVRET